MNALTEIVEITFRSESYDKTLQIAYDHGNYNLLEVADELRAYVQLRSHYPIELDAHLWLDKVQWHKLAETFISEAYEVFGDAEEDRMLSESTHRQER